MEIDETRNSDRNNDNKIKRQKSNRTKTWLKVIRIDPHKKRL